MAFEFEFGGRCLRSGLGRSYGSAIFSFLKREQRVEGEGQTQNDLSHMEDIKKQSKGITNGQRTGRRQNLRNRV